MKHNPKSLLSLALVCLLLVLVCALCGCATSQPSTYREWKDKQEVKAQAARMLRAVEGVTFKGTKNSEQK